MKRRSNGFYFLWIILICIVSCDKQDVLVHYKVDKEFTNKSFPSTIYLEQNKLVEDFVGSPVRLTVIDTLLFAVDSKLDSLLHIYNIQSDIYYGLAVGRGSGPNELLSIGYITPSYKKEYVWAYDITTRQWFEYNKEELIWDKRAEKTDRVQFLKDMEDDIYIDEPTWISQDLFLASSFNHHKERLFLVNRNLEVEKRFYNDKLNFTDHLPEPILNDLFSISYAIKPDKSKVVLTGKYFDCIEIFDIKGNLVVCTKGPEQKFDFKFDRARSLNHHEFIKSPETKRAYLSVKTTDKYIYALYSGKEKQDKNHYSNSNTLFVFDWNGNPVKRIIVDCEIRSFDISKENEFLYAINANTSNIIFYQLPEE